MSSLEEIKIGLEGIAHKLLDSNLAVPRYQRSYAWKDEHVKDLFQDLATAIRSKEKEYFLGTIVVATTTDAKSFEVIDGQQRLATTTILLGAIRDYFHSVGDANRASDIERTYLVTRDLRTQEPTPKLRLNDVDHDFFSKRILSDPSDAARGLAPTAESHRRIAKAADLAARQVANLTQERKPEDNLVDWVEYLRTRARVIWVRVPDDTNAFTIFETLNDRGLALTIADLLKNFLFGRADSRVAEVQQRWIAMTGLLEAQDDEEVIVDYIRHFWSSKHGMTRERYLYADIKKKITSQQAAVDFANELADEARIYAALRNPNHEFWVPYGATSRGHIGTLNLLGMIQIRPLLLSVLAKFKAGEVRKTLTLLVSWAVRFTIYGGLGSGPLETHYSSTAKQVRDGVIKSASALLKAMKDVVPSDTVFREAFARASVSKSQLARYYVAALEKQAGGEIEPEFVPNLNEEQINLEHVLPQTPSADWAHVDLESQKLYCKRLGNLCLMKRTENQTVGNDSFATKKRQYAASLFKLTKSISKEEDWGPTEIEKRQAVLADLAVKTWPNKA